MTHKIKEYAILLVIVGFLAYIPSLFGNFVWDDEDFVYANTYVQEFQIDKFFTENAIAGRGKISNYYRPMQFSLYAALYKLAGPQPWVFHLAGVLLHVGAGVLIFLTFTHFMAPFPSFVAAVLFLLHPVQTESVSYISGLSDQLYTSFFFGSILLFLMRKHAGISKEAVLSLIFFVFAVLSKELGIILPGILLLMTLLQGKGNKKDAVVFALFFALAAFYLVLRFTILQFADASLLWSGLAYGAHFTTRLATFFHNFFVFLSLLVFPVSLFMERDFSIPIITNMFSGWTFAFFIFNLVIIAVLWHFRKIKAYRNALLFYVLFVASLVPYTGIFLLNGIFYEHYLYLPMAFFWAAAVSAITPIMKRQVVLGALAFILVLFVVRSFARQWDWISNERFYRQTLTHAPKSIRIINGLAMTLADEYKCNEALTYYQRAIDISPHVPNIYHNMANCYAFLGKVDEAEKAYLKALNINPNFSYSYVSLLELYLKTNQAEKAKTFLKEQIIPRYPDNQEMRMIYERLQ